MDRRAAPDWASPASSYLALVHGASDVGADDMPEAERRYNSQASAQFNARSREQVARFFGGLDLLGSGVVNLSRWWQPSPVGAEADVAAYCGLARKP